MNDRVDPLQKMRYRVDKLLTQKKWNDALSLLREKDGEVAEAFSTERGELFRELRLSYLFFRLGDMRRANQYLEPILKDNENEGEALLMMGYFCLLEDKKEDAIFYYTTLLPQKEYQRKAKRILLAIKNASNVLDLTMKKPLSFFIDVPHISLSYYVKNFANDFLSNLSKIFTSKKFYYRLGIVAGAFFVFLLLTRLALGKHDFYQMTSKFFNYFREVGLMSSWDPSSQRLWDDMVAQPSTNVEQALSVSLKDVYRKMEKDIATGNINGAIISYNEALLLNPPLQVKQRFETLASFIPSPSWNDFSNDQRIEVLRKSPALYKDTYWKFVGRVSNVLLNDEKLRFRLLIFSEQSLQEVVTVEFEKPQIIPINGFNYEVLMRFSGNDRNGNLAMTGVAMQRIAK